MAKRLLFPLCVMALLTSCSNQDSSNPTAESSGNSNSSSPAIENASTPVTPAPAPTPVRAFEKSDIAGGWPCDTGAAPGIIQSMPPAESQIAQGIQGFAPSPSRFEYALSKGGPTGMFAQAHLHGIHEDRGGTTYYTALVLVKDQSGYYYAALPLLKTHVDGSSRRPRTHVHCGGQFTFSEALAATINRSIDNGNKISLEFLGGRDRKSMLETLPNEIREKLKKLTDDPENTVALVAALNGSPGGAP